jgi:hypothetical protein
MTNNTFFQGCANSNSGISLAEKMQHQTGHPLIPLHHTPHGFIGFCDHCQKIHLAFGVVFMQLDLTEFRTWHLHLQAEMHQAQHRICPKEKHFLFPTESPNLRLLFNWKELEQLDELIAPALLMLETNEILGNRSHR